MAKFKPYKILESQLDSLPIKEGQFILTTDTKKLYSDTAANTRILISPDAITDLSVNGKTITYTRLDGTTGTITTQDTTYSVASETKNGLMSSDDKAKLNAIESGAQKNTVTGVKGDSESLYRTGNINITKANIGLNNVENKSSATIRGELTSSNVTTALGYTPLESTLKGANNGLAELDASGKVPTSQLPSYVDDVLEYSAKANFPTTGETGKIYVDTSNNKTYRWGGSAYAEISPSIALGTTSSTAFRGDYGQAAYTHAVTNKGSQFNSGLYKITTNAEGHVTGATAVVKSDITALGIPAQDTTYSAATTSAAGLMSSADKTKLDGIAAGAQKNTITGVKGNAETSYRTGNVNITAANIGLGNVENKSSETIRGELTKANVTTALGYTPPTTNTTYEEATTSKAGLMSTAMVTKLNGIETGAQVNTITGVKGNSESTYRTGNVNITKSNIGLGNVDNTSDANKPVSTAQQTALDAKLSKSGGTLTGNVNGGALDVHPEHNGTVISYYTNDLVNLFTRGGTCVATNITTNTVINSAPTNWFDGTPSYQGFTVNAKTDIVEIMIKSPTEYSWTTMFGIGFGADNWKASDVKFEIGYETSKGTVWATRYDITGSGKAIHSFSSQGPGTTNTTTGTDGSTITGTSSNTWNRIKITLTNFTTTTPRIAQIWSINYGSKGLANNFLQQSGGSLYGNLNPYKNDTYNLGTTEKKFKTIYATTFEGTATNASKVNNLTVETAVPANAKFTDTTYTGENGVTVSGTKISNSGVRSIATGTTNGTISVDTNGSSAEVAVKGLSAAAYKGIDTSIAAASTSTNLPTSKAVAAFVEGKGYKTTDNNTTYTFATGDSNGQIKVTPSSGSATNVSVKGLAAAAYKGVDTTLTSESTSTNLPTSKAVADLVKSEIGNASSGVNPSDLLDLIYPVGSIYMSVVDVSPSTFLGGTWERLKDRFLLGAGDTYTAGATGGSATKTIAKENLPNYNLYSASHTHTFTGSSSSFSGSGNLKRGDYTVVAADANGGPTWRYILKGGTGLSTYSDYYSISVSGSITAKGSNSSTTITVSSGGSGTALDVMNPYLTVYMWKRISGGGEPDVPG